MRIELAFLLRVHGSALRRVMNGAGHNFGASLEPIADSFADALAFAFETVGR